MAKTAASHVWEKFFKYAGPGGFDFIARCPDIGATTHWVGQGYMLANVDGELCIAAGMGTADHFDYSISVAEKIVDDDRYFLAHRDGGKVLHNQKLAGTYKIGDALYQTAAGTWTYAKSATAASLLCRLGFLAGPTDRITSTVVKGIDDAFTTTEPVDIFI